MMKNAKQIDQKINISGMVEEVFGKNLHPKQKESLGYAALGLLESESLILHRMGQGLAKARGVEKKHATKQIDRLLSNKKLSVWDLSGLWAHYLLDEAKEILVALDWSAFADDKQSMLSLNLVSPKGLSVPLLWKSVENARMKHNRARYEDQLLTRLKEILPANVQVTLLADRGFLDHKFLRFLSEELQFYYVIRIKSNTTIIAKESRLKASEHLNKANITVLKNVGVTLKNYPVRAFVAVQDKEMKAAWYLVTNKEISGSEIIKLYAKRWKIEPYFRDLKNGRYGYGMEDTHYKSAERRDRLMLMVVLCYRLLVILGQAGEEIGFDKKLKVNTVKTRTHSLFTQGQFYYDFLDHFKAIEQQQLIAQFSSLLQTQNFWGGLLSNQNLEGNS